jgi:Extensin-like protein C-terminus
VLGPGSDGYHESHIHVDLTERRGGYRICQWDIRTEPEVPLPRVRPPEAPQPQAQTQTQTPTQTQTQTRTQTQTQTQQQQMEENPFRAPTRKN